MLNRGLVAAGATLVIGGSCFFLSSTKMFGSLKQVSSRLISR